MPKNTINIIERLEKFTDKKTNSCWIWKGGTSGGYPVIGIEGMNRQSRRIYFEIYKRHLIENQCLISACKNKLCVNPDHMMTRDDRFVSNLKMNDENNCWEWIGSKNNKGYGVFGINGKMKLSHRIIYEKHKGKIPNGLLVLHKCDNTKCCNPEHLYLGNQLTNMDDMHKRNRDNKAHGETHVRAKMSEKEVKEIRYKFNQGMTILKLSQLYPISYHSIWCICRNKTWKHV